MTHLEEPPQQKPSVAELSRGIIKFMLETRKNAQHFQGLLAPWSQEATIADSFKNEIELGMEAVGEIIQQYGLQTVTYKNDLGQETVGFLDKIGICYGDTTPFEWLVLVSSPASTLQTLGHLSLDSITGFHPLPTALLRKTAATHIDF